MDRNQLKQKIQGASRMRVQPVDVTEWSDLLDGVTTLHVRKLSVTERDAFETQRFRVVERGDKHSVQFDFTDQRSRLLVKTLSDPDGNRLFTDAELASVQALDGGLGDKLFDAAMAFNGLSVKPDQAKKN